MSVRYSLTRSSSSRSTRSFGNSHLLVSRSWSWLGRVHPEHANWPRQARHRRARVRPQSVPSRHAVPPLAKTIAISGGLPTVHPMEGSRPRSRSPSTARATRRAAPSATGEVRVSSASSSARNASIARAPRRPPGRSAARRGGRPGLREQHGLRHQLRPGRGVGAETPSQRRRRDRCVRGRRIAARAPPTRRRATRSPREPRVLAHRVRAGTRTRARRPSGRRLPTRRSGRNLFHRRGHTLRGRRAADGRPHPLGLAGIAMSRTPSGESASTTALITVAAEPIVPASPMPFTPIGLVGDGVTVWSRLKFARDETGGPLFLRQVGLLSEASGKSHSMEHGSRLVRHAHGWRQSSSMSIRAIVR